MNLLYANDRPGRYPNSWYAATAEPLGEFSPLRTDVCGVDVCIIGAGYTGLSAALHLAQQGRRVLVLEAQRVGFGASGRNGGQLGSGQRLDQCELQQMFGLPRARQLWEVAQEGKNLVKSLIQDHKIECYLRPGVAHATKSMRNFRYAADAAALMSQEYGYNLELLERDAFHELCPSPYYCGGYVDWDAAHLHPLRYALGLARAAVEAGAEIHEGTQVLGINGTQVHTHAGTVQAEHVILACNGYLGDLSKQVAARVMPINNFIAATAPLKEPERIVRRDIAVADDRFVVNYFRLSHDGRLLFGGGESYGYRFPTNIAAKVRKPMARIFPHLENVDIDYAWGGTLAITIKRLPYLARLTPRVLSASGYSGHGVASATHAGQLMALAIMGETDGFDAMSALPSTPFPGRHALRTPLLALAMSWYALRDKLG